MIADSPDTFLPAGETRSPIDLSISVRRTVDAEAFRGVGEFAKEHFGFSLGSLTGGTMPHRRIGIDRFAAVFGDENRVL